MRIAYLCKRQYMGYDVIRDRYARLYAQPRHLALRGHDVLGLCLSYRRVDAREEQHPAEPGSMRWVGLVPQDHPTGVLGYPTRALTRLRAFRPGLLVAASDALHVVLGHWLAGRLNVPFAADLYDHFELLRLSRLPGVVPLYRRALRQAAVVSCVSEPLARLVRERYRTNARVLSLPSTVDRGLFHPRDKGACRRALGLPDGARLVGTAGTLSRSRGIDSLYRAFMHLADTIPDLHLILAGAVDARSPPPPHPRVHSLGQLPHAATAELFSALDVGVIYLRDTPFGRYSFPQKAYEMAACGVPLVVARVGSMADTFARDAELYDADDSRALADALARQLAAPRVPAIPIPDWAEQAVAMEAAYQAVLQRNPDRSPT